LYLGQSVPFNDLLTVTDVVPADVIVTVFTNRMEGISVQDYLNNLSKSFPNSQIMVSGRAFFDENDPLSSQKMLFCSNLTNNLKMCCIVLTLHLMHTNLIKLFIVSVFTFFM
jgi:hypothetical protein